METTKRWVVIAKDELRRMDTFARMLPLAAALRGSFDIARSCSIGMCAVGEPENRHVLLGGRAQHKAGDEELCAILLGTRTQVHCDFSQKISFLIDILLERGFGYSTETDETEARVRSLNSTILEWRTASRLLLLAKAKELVEAVKTSIMDITDRHALKLNQRALYEDTELAKDAATLITLLLALGRAITQDELLILNEMFHLGINNIKEYNTVRRRFETANRERIALMRRKYLFACPQAIAELKRQSEIIRSAPTRYTLITDAEQRFVMQSHEDRRIQNHEEELLRARFPCLYKRMMRTRTVTEQRGQAVKNLVRQLVRREGMPIQFVHGCLGAGIRNREEIIELYLKALYSQNDSKPETVRQAGNSIYPPEYTTGWQPLPTAAPIPVQVQTAQRKKHPLDDIPRKGWESGNFHRLLSRWGFSTDGNAGKGGHLFVVHRASKIRLRHTNGRFVIVTHSTCRKPITPGQANGVLNACADFLAARESL